MSETTIYTAISTIEELDTGIYFDNNEFLVMDVLNSQGNIIDQAVMTGYYIVHI